MEKTTYCSRCQGVMPNEETPGAHRGALSRYDNTTYVCDRCGTQESILDAQGVTLPPVDQPLPAITAAPFQEG